MNIHGGGTVHFNGCTVKCPECAASTVIPNGTYDARGLVRKIIEASPTVDELSAFIAALRSPAAQEGPETAKAAVEVAAPRLAPLVFDDPFGITPSQWVGSLKLLLTALGPVLIAMGGGVAVTAASLIAVAMLALSNAEKKIEAQKKADDPDTRRRERNKRKKARQLRK
ncbi:MAG TPA: hypothetical protein VFK05_36670 [Polyangiaceae bacterium]|nr:hypothetical protein [Polyangiaceae bacterium]